MALKEAKKPTQNTSTVMVKGSLTPIKMSQELAVFKESMDSWIKQVRSEVADFNEISNITEENIGNIQHNYELIHELKSQVEELKQELNALKLIQIISLKEKIDTGC